MDRVQLRRSVEKSIWEALSERGLPSEPELINLLSWLAQRDAREAGLGPKDVAAVTEQILQSFRCLGPLWAPMFDPSVSEIMVNGPFKVFVERQGVVELTPIRFSSPGHLTGTIERIMSYDPHARLDSSKPMVDVALPDGSRANIAIPPVVVGAEHLTIRKYQGKFSDIHGLVQVGSIDERMAALLVAATQARLNILFSGGTGTGKTTLLEVLSRTIAPDERVICIEDTLEVHFEHINVVRMLTRLPNIEGKGEITIRDLFRNSLRMCPDRIILGEIRGREAFDYLQALNSGHAGSLAVIHASSPEEAVIRLQNLVPLAGLGVPPSVVTQQIAHGVNLIVQIEQARGGRRLVSRISEVAGLTYDGAIDLRDLYYWRSEPAPADLARGSFRASGNVPTWFEQIQSVAPELDVSMFKQG